MPFRAGETVCRICGADVAARPTGAVALRLGGLSVTDWIAGGAGFLFVAFMLVLAAVRMSDFMEQKRDRAGDPTLPVAIGDNMKKVTDRCGQADRVNSLSDARGTWHFLEYKSSSEIPSDCFGKHTFQDDRLASTYR